MGAPRASQPLIRNAIQAAQECGVRVGEIIIESDGAIRIVAHSDAKEIPSGPTPIKWGAQQG